MIRFSLFVDVSLSIFLHNEKREEFRRCRMSYVDGYPLDVIS